jgi:hypothetical protein
MRLATALFPTTFAVWACRWGRGKQHPSFPVCCFEVLEHPMAYDRWASDLLQHAELRCRTRGTLLRSTDESAIAPAARDNFPTCRVARARRLPSAEHQELTTRTQNVRWLRAPYLTALSRIQLRSQTRCGRCHGLLGPEPPTQTPESLPLATPARPPRSAAAFPGSPLLLLLLHGSPCFLRVSSLLPQGFPRLLPGSLLWVSQTQVPPREPPRPGNRLARRSRHTVTAARVGAR